MAWSIDSKTFYILKKICEAIVLYLKVRKKLPNRKKNFVKRPDVNKKLDIRSSFSGVKTLGGLWIQKTLRPKLSKPRSAERSSHLKARAQFFVKVFGASWLVTVIKAFTFFDFSYQSVLSFLTFENQNILKLNQSLLKGGMVHRFQNILFSKEDIRSDCSMSEG